MHPVETSATIQVDLDVTRYREFPKDGMVEIWGYVGDYEVSIWLPITDKRVEEFVGKRRGRRPANGKIGGE